MLSQLVQFRFVVDSNIVLREVTWLATERRQPDARTALQELVRSGTAILFAPVVLQDEIERHIPRRALELGISPEVLRNQWREYRPYLRFCANDSTVPQDMLIVDTDDLPFVVLWQEVGAAAVISSDRHISMMGASRIELDVVLRLRDYARAKSVETTIVVGGTCFVVSASMAMIKVSVLLGHILRRLPRWVQGVLLACVAGLLLCPASRHKIITTLKRVLITCQEGLCQCQPVIEECLQILATASYEARTKLSAVNEAVQLTRHIPLRTIAYSVCLASDGPLQLHEVEKRVRMHGYRSKSKDFPAYLRRVLATDSRFLRGPRGYSLTGQPSHHTCREC